MADMKQAMRPALFVGYRTEHICEMNQTEILIPEPRRDPLGRKSKEPDP